MFFENKNNVFNYLQTKNLSSNAIAALMGTISKETGSVTSGYEGTFDYLQKQDEGPGEGLFMLDPGGDHVEQYGSFLQRNERENSAEAQIDYMLESIYDTESPALVSNGIGNAGELRKIFETGSIEDITREFTKRWERPRDYLNYKEDPDNKDFEKAYEKNISDRKLRADGIVEEFKDRLFENG